MMCKQKRRQKYSAHIEHLYERVVIRRQVGGTVKFPTKPDVQQAE